MTVAAVALLLSCSKDEPSRPVVQQAARPADVSVTVRFSLPGSRVGDPGTGHSESDGDWQRLAFYFVYDNGRVYTHIVERDDFYESCVFTVDEGVARIYAAAFPERHQTITAAQSADQVRNMVTTDAMSAVPTNVDDRKDYMLSFFSGVSGKLTIEAEAENQVSLVLNRLVAKVDVQWDVQPGIDGGSFVDAAMSAITFRGYSAGYVFPTRADATRSWAIADLATIDGTVSARNGRSYFYSFPGDGCGFEFDVTYDDADGRTPQAYNATFDAAINADEWHKVNISVRGMDVVGTADPVDLTLRQ